MNILKHKLSTVVIAAWLALSGMAVASETNTPVVSAYFVQWGVYARDYHVSDIPAELVTHINYAFAKPVYDSSNDVAWLESADPYADLENLYPGDTTNQAVRGNFNQLRLLKQEHPHLKTLISIGGWTLSADFSAIAASANARTSFANSCVSFVTNYGFDGVDMDWEFPVSGGSSGTPHRPDDADNFVLLLQSIRTALDNAGGAVGSYYLLTTTGSAAYNSVNTRYRLADMTNLVDWIHVMAYNYSGDWSAVSGHTAPLFENPAAEVPRFNVDETVRAYLDAGVPASRLVLGVPFVGFGLRNVSPANDGLFQPHGGASAEGTWNSGFFDYEDLVDGTQGHGYVNSNGFTRFWDETSGVPYLYNSSNRVFVSYEDIASIHLKADYARTRDLRGMMYWSMDADSQDARLQTMIGAVLNPPELSSVRTVFTPAEGRDDVAISWLARSGQTYGLWYATNLIAPQWVRATWLVDSLGNPQQEVAGSNVVVELIDTNNAAGGYYQIRMPADGEWP